MCIALLERVSFVSITYDHQRSSTLRDPAAQTADGEVQIAGPPLIQSNAVIPFVVATACA